MVFLLCDKIDVNCESIYSDDLFSGKIKPMLLSIEYENIEIIKILLSNSKIDLNFKITYYCKKQKIDIVDQSLLNFVIHKNNRDILNITFIMIINDYFIKW